MGEENWELWWAKLSIIFFVFFIPPSFSYTFESLPPSSKLMYCLKNFLDGKKYTKEINSIIGGRWKKKNKIHSHKIDRKCAAPLRCWVSFIVFGVKFISISNATHCATVNEHTARKNNDIICILLFPNDANDDDENNFTKKNLKLYRNALVDDIIIFFIIFALGLFSAIIPLSASTAAVLFEVIIKSRIFASLFLGTHY